MGESSGRRQRTGEVSAGRGGEYLGWGELSVGRRWRAEEVSVGSRRAKALAEEPTKDVSVWWGMGKR